MLLDFYWFQSIQNCFVSKEIAQFLLCEGERNLACQMLTWFSGDGKLLSDWRVDSFIHSFIHACMLAFCGGLHSRLGKSGVFEEGRK